MRPTAVLGPGSPTLASLRRLASAPIGVLFGSGQTLVRLLNVAPLGGRTIELGGPDRLTMGDLLRRLRREATGREGPWLRVPAAPLRRFLALVEPVLFPVLPFTAGQLASFVNDGCARPDPLTTQIHCPSRGVGEMLRAERP